MSAFPATRLRRLRRTDALRSLVRETRLDLDDFVMPVFVGPSTVRNEELPAMSRFSVEDLVGEEDNSPLGVPRAAEEGDSRDEPHDRVVQLPPG